jgi:hypothetical protein
MNLKPYRDKCYICIMFFLLGILLFHFYNISNCWLCGVTSYAPGNCVIFGKKT